MTPLITALLVILIIWELIMKGIALWKASRNDHKTWFIVILILNTAGILPLIYVLFFSEKKKTIGLKKKK
ncbi:MAG: DUF5652 family protein [Candidatus Nanoarchaeia archaeon]|nr:DUF5652 family protein [Candidatus Nanoarchaeia archaeon]